jgi:hypothetical protein
MAVVKSIPINRYVNGRVINNSESVVVSEKEYTTSGEYTVIIKSVDHCELFLDHNTTIHCVIKALTNVTLKPLEGLIDEEWDDIELTKGACVELKYILHNWYILSSDGLKGS